MNNAQIPDGDHVVRLCSGGSIDKGRVTRTAFFLKDQEFVSVNWLEFLRLPNRIDEITEVRRVLVAKRLALRRTGRLAVLNVGRTKQKVRTESKQEIQVNHHPKLDDPSHSGIVYPTADATVVEYLAQFVADSVVETHPAATI